MAPHLHATGASPHSSVAIPYLAFIGVFGFVPLPGMLLIMVTAITALYVVGTALTKKRFYRCAL